MNNTMEHHAVNNSSEQHHHNHSDHISEHGEHKHKHSGMALSATLHCLTGCAIGEMSGMIVGVSLGLNPWTTVALSITLAFIFGYALSMLPLLKNGISLGKALKLVLIADTLSILSMEIAENLIMIITPGAMHSGISNPIFWITMSFAFLVGFAVAYPVNKILLQRGKGHAITHDAIGHHDMNNKPLTFALIAFMLGGLITSVFG